MKRRLKKSAVYSLYAVSFILLVIGISIPLLAIKRIGDNKFQYVSKGILDYEKNAKVVNSTTKILRPYNIAGVDIVKSYYDYKAEASSQEKSLIYYEGTYMPSSGVAYSNGDIFDVIAILDGTVTEIKEDVILGNVITIEHENGITSVYQSISDIVTKEGDAVNAGQVIAKSATSNISKELNNHLYFELIINGICVNPENYYDKSINEI